MEAFDMSIYDKMFQPEVVPEVIPETTKVKSNTVMTPFPKETPIAMAYVPFQMWEKPYDDAVGFVRGTIFPSLDKPFIGEEAVKNASKR